MSSVLFDVPGPQARRRQRLWTVLISALLLALAVVVVRKLSAEGQLSGQVWEPFVTPKFVNALLEGALATVRTAVVAILLAIAFGAFFAVGRLSQHGWVRWPSALVVEFFRAVPLLMLILGIYLAYASELGKFWALVLGLTLYNGSVLAELFRAGILAVPGGQSEAAYALGMRKTQVMSLVLLPQAARIMLPAIISQSVVALKDTSLGYVISYEELAFVGRQISIQFNNSFAAAVVLAAIFIVLNYGLSRLAVWLEARLARRGRTAATGMPGDTELTRTGGA